MKASDSQAFSAIITEIEEVDRTDCLKHWREVFGRSPPKYLSPRFMKRVLIWDAQCQLLGWVPAKTDRVLRQIAAVKTPPVTLKQGSHLIREWNGRTYQVEVTRNGFVMDGKNYRSLTAIARRVTGAQWSGPRFFGLT